MCQTNAKASSQRHRAGLKRRVTSNFHTAEYTSDYINTAFGLHLYECNRDNADWFLCKHATARTGCSEPKVIVILVFWFLRIDTHMSEFKNHWTIILERCRHLRSSVSTRNAASLSVPLPACCVCLSSAGASFRQPSPKEALLPTMVRTRRFISWLNWWSCLRRVQYVPCIPNERRIRLLFWAQQAEPLSPPRMD